MQFNAHASFYQNSQCLFCQNVFFCVSPNNTLANVSSYAIYQVDIGGSSYTNDFSPVNTSLVILLQTTPNAHQVMLNSHQTMSILQYLNIRKWQFYIVGQYSLLIGNQYTYACPMHIKRCYPIIFISPCTVITYTILRILKKQ